MSGAAEASGDGLVSVVIIFLDEGAFLDEAIRSVVAQTYDRWELLLVDDGSRDASPEIARGWARRMPGRVRYLTHPGGVNRGMSASRNLGIRAARGAYVALLDGDDVWLPSKLASQVEALEAHPRAAMAYDAAWTWYSWGGAPDDAARDRPRKLGVAPGTLVPPPGLIPLFLGGLGEPPGTCSVLIRRTAILEVGGFEDQFRGMYEDQAFFFKLCLAHPVLAMGGSTSLYRQHAGSTCHRAEADGSYHRWLPNRRKQDFLQWLDAYLAGHHPSDRALRRLVREEMKAFGRLSRHPFWNRLERKIDGARNRVIRLASHSLRLLG